MTASTPHADIIENLRVIVDSAGELIDDDDVLAAQFAIDAMTRTADALAAVTAERDQALEALAATNKLGAFETGKTIGAAEVRKELDQARQMLADAPHAEDCMLGFHYEDATVGVCYCWKAGL